MMNNDTDAKPTTEPITAATTAPTSSNAPANRGNTLDDEPPLKRSKKKERDRKAINNCRTLIVQLGPQLLAALFDAAESALPLLRFETRYSVDGTGFGSSSYDRYFADKHIPSLRCKPTKRHSWNAPANRGHALEDGPPLKKPGKRERDWKAINNCRTLIAHLGPQLLASLFDDVEPPQPTPGKRGASPALVFDIVLFVAVGEWRSATAEEVVSQPQVSAPR